MIKKLSIAAIALMTVWSLPALASRETAPEPEVRERVCVYEHENYGGFEQCFTGGEDISDLGRLRNRISSVRILGRGKIVLYDNRNFRGREIVITSDIPSLYRLGAWNDAASSLRVGFGGPRDRGDYRRDDYRRDDRRDDYPRDLPPRDDYRGERRAGGDDRVCFFQHANFRGDSECWDLRDDVTELDSRGWNNRISSIRVFGRTQLYVFERKNYGGERLVVEADIADLAQIQQGNWDNRISSFRVFGGQGRR